MYAWETNEILKTVAEAQKQNATKLNQTRRENRQQIIQKKKTKKEMTTRHVRYRVIRILKPFKICYIFNKKRKL